MSKKKLTYQELIELLQAQQHKAPDVWESLADELDLQEGLSQLPEHKAPEGLWGGIEKSLVEEDQALGKKDRYRIYLLVAGFVIMILSSAIVYLMGERNLSNKVVYKSEIEMAAIDDSKVEIAQDLDEVLSYIQHNEFVFTTEELEKFQEQLAELNTAIERIISVQSQYGQDESTTKLLARMERDKADLIKQMIAAIS